MQKKSAVSYITDKAAFMLAVASVQKRGAKLDADIQHLALSAIHHAEQHGNVHYVNALYLALSAGARKSALTAWLLAFGKVSANAGENKKDMPFLFDKTKHTNMEEATANPWFNFKPDADPDQVFDIQAALATIIKKAQGKNVDALALAKVENLANELKNAAKTEAKDKDPLETTV